MTIIPIQRRENLSRARESWRDFDREFSRLFDSVWGETPALAADYAPQLDVQETPKELIVHADLPGLDKKDIQVRLENGVLTLSGTRRAEHEESSKDKTWHRVERSWGSFQRSLQLGSAADATKVNAEYKDGVLTVTVPKKEASQPKVIEVK